MISNVWQRKAQNEARRREEVTRLLDHINTQPPLAPPTFRGDNARAQTIIDPTWILSGPYETGKTWAALWRLDQEARRNPKGQYALVRKVRNDMDGSVLVTWRRVIERAGGGVSAFGGERVQWYDYPNGARVWVGGLDRPEKTLSGERDGVYVNQAEELSENDWEMLTRSTTGRGAVTKTPMLFGDCNPGGEDHWILDRMRAGTLTLLKSTHTDNPSLYNDDGTLTEQGERSMSILDAMTGVRYSRGRLGMWVGAEGAYFDRLDESIHLIDNITLPPGWQAWAALDYGFTHPLSFGVFARGGERGQTILLGHHARSKWYLKQHATAMDELLDLLRVPKRGLKVVAGHDCWATSRDDPETVADKFADLGYHLERANIARVQGAVAVGEAVGNLEAGVPATLLFCRRAKPVFDTLARMVHDPRNPEDVLKANADANGRGGDDDYDMLRYGVMARPTGAWDADAVRRLSSGRRV